MIQACEKPKSKMIFFGNTMDILHRTQDCIFVRDLLVAGLKHKGLFRISASVHKVKTLKAKYDKGEKVTLEQEDDIDAIASLLKVFLKELPEGVVPEPSHPSFIGAYRDVARFRRILPRAHRNVLLYLCFFLIQVASFSDINNMTLENLSVVFGPSFFRYVYYGVGQVAFWNNP
uniref:Rho-GAP domain-containing protein n=1 Tax=Xenopus tropicalis TaxID=8364 RepID=F7CAW1_XENTR